MTIKNWNDWKEHAKETKQIVLTKAGESYLKKNYKMTDVLSYKIKNASFFGDTVVLTIVQFSEEGNIAIPGVKIQRSHIKSVEY